MSLRSCSNNLTPNQRTFSVKTSFLPSFIRCSVNVSITVCATNHTLPLTQSVFICYPITYFPVNQSDSSLLTNHILSLLTNHILSLPTNHILSLLTNHILSLLTNHTLSLLTNHILSLDQKINCSCWVCSRWLQGNSKIALIKSSLILRGI